MREYLRKIANGEDVSNWKWTGEVTELPKEFTGWMEENAGRLQKMQEKGNLPYFVRNNYDRLSNNLREEYKEVTFEEYKKMSESMNVTKDEEKALYDADTKYIDSSWSREINKELTEGKVGKVVPNDFMDDKESFNAVNVLDRVIEKNTIDKPIVVHRAVSKYWVTEQGKNIRVGDVINEYRYTSTSAEKDKNYFSRRDVHIEVEIPAGTKGFVTKNADESEIMLARNSKFRVLSIEEVEGKTKLRFSCQK